MKFLNMDWIWMAFTVYIDFEHVDFVKFSGIQIWQHNLFWIETQNAHGERFFLFMLQIIQKRKLNIDAGEPLVDEGPKQGGEKGEESKDAEDYCHKHFPSSLEASTHLQISGHHISRM